MTLPKAQQLALLNLPSNLAHAMSQRTVATAADRMASARGFWGSPQTQQALRWVLKGGEMVGRDALVREWSGVVEYIMSQERDAQRNGKISIGSTTADALAGGGCDAPVESLRPIMIAEMRGNVGEVNHGRVLWCELISPVGKQMAVTGIVADKTGAATVMSMYNLVAGDADTAARAADLHGRGVQSDCALTAAAPRPAPLHAAPPGLSTAFPTGDGLRGQGALPQDRLLGPPRAPRRPPRQRHRAPAGVERH